MFRTIICLSAVLGLAACATPTPYQGAAEGAYGFTEQAIESDRYRVSFSGNSLTDRQTVENYLLYRAAELTLERGYDHFSIAQRDTDADRRTVGSVGDPFYSPYGFRYRYYHPAFGWYGYRDPFRNDVNVREITRYQAQAEIVFGRGPAPDTPDAFEAREVVQNLGPTIVLPDIG
jgi:hypothetical protein